MESKQLLLGHVHQVAGGSIDMHYQPAFSVGQEDRTRAGLEKFLELGGFNEAMVLGDDWELTRMIPRKKFGVANTFIWTTNRRFQSQGYIRTISKYFRVALSRQISNRPKYNFQFLKTKEMI